MNWVLSQESDRNSSGESGKSTPEPIQVRGVQLKPDTSMPPPAPVTSKPFTMPVNSMNYMLDSLRTDKGEFILKFLFYSHLRFCSLTRRLK